MNFKLQNILVTFPAAVKSYTNDKLSLLREIIEYCLEPYTIAFLLKKSYAENAIVTLTGPPESGVAQLLRLAPIYGIEVVYVDNAPFNIKKDNDFESILSKIKNDKTKIRLIYTGLNYNNPEDYPKEFANVLVFPREKKWLKKLKRNKASDYVNLAKSSYYKFKEHVDQYDIILDEEQSPRRILWNLLYKIGNFYELNQRYSDPKFQSACPIRCFIIWGHGLKYQDEIKSILEDSFEIIIIKSKRIKNIRNTIRQIYKAEILKIGRHIINKNMYLSKCRRSALLIVARNKGFEKRFNCQGHGRTKNVCSTYPEHVKQLIRDKYNPKKPSGMRTEQHVLHSSDIPVQVDDTLKVFELKPLCEW